QRSVVTMQ
ncbi:alcohol dehydrogenase/acetaldehyde dehydrogenase, partial [Vibrio parahaemolyticus EKP-021]